MNTLKFSAIGLVIAIASAGSATAADLFTPVTPDASISSSAPAQPQVAATHFAKIDSTGLTAALKGSLGGTTVSLNIIPGVNIPVVVDRTDPAIKGMSAFAAHSPGDIASSSTIVVHDGTVYAVLQYNNQTYEINYVANGIHKITLINQDKFPGDKVINGLRPNLPAVASLDAKGVSITSAGVAVEPDILAPAPPPPTVVTIKVTICSTPLVRTHHSNWLSTAQAAITDANSSFANSAVNAKFVITKFCNINNYDETNLTFDDMLSGLQAATFMHTWRDTNKADLVAIFRDDSGLGNDFCGLGDYVTTPSAATKAAAYSIVNIGCAVGNHSYIHEAGHNMGLKHDRYVEGTLGSDKSHFNYGYSNRPFKVRTIMAYANDCNDHGVTCTRVGFFSNPAKTSNGGVLGVLPGKTNPADNALRLGQTIAAIAAYR